jgi:NitT/TauT family transport system permease protein
MKRPSRSWSYLTVLVPLAAFAALLWRVGEAVRFVWRNPIFPLVYDPGRHPPYAFGILDSVAATPMRVIVGTALGFSVGVAIGVLATWLPWVRPTLLLPARLLAPVAPLVWLPLTFLLIRSAELSAILLVALGNVFIVAVSSFILGMNVDERFLAILQAFGANERQLVWRVRVPSMVPMLLVLLRLELFAGWMAVLAAEMSGVRNGLGTLLMLGRSLGNIDLILLAASAIALLAGSLDFAVARAARVLVNKIYGGWIFARI